MPLDFVQSMRRLGQQLNGWKYSGEMLRAQLSLIKKLYAKNGLELRLTCEACPEQYDVFKDGKQVGYLRLRHGSFSVDYPGCMDENIYHAEPNGDGTFNENERLIYLTRAMRAILKKISSEQDLQRSVATKDDSSNAGGK